MNSINDKCLISGGSVMPILNLGMHPYADTFIGSDQQHLSEPVLPLVCNLSPSSGLIQLGYVSNDWDRYNLYSYSYTSSNGAYSRNHWDQLADELKKQLDLVDQLVVEVGSNDGYLLHQFADHNRVVGVDASADMCVLCRERGVRNVYHAVLDKKISDSIKYSNSAAKLIIANNVLNHANDPVDFVQSVANLLDPDGWFVFEVPSWPWMMQQRRWDMIYHEHVSYFTITSLTQLLQQAGLSIAKVDIVDYHGKSFRVWARHQAQVGQTPEQVIQLTQTEQASGLFQQEFYHKLALEMQQQRHKTLDQLLQIKIQHPDRPIIGVGAAAKANTWLNYHGINQLIMDYVTDASPQKQGKYTPLSRIPIVGDDIFACYDQPLALVLSWNISSRLQEAILSINNRTEFIKL